MSLLRLARSGSPSLLLAVLAISTALAGCNKEDKKASDEDTSTDDKQAKIDALLKENGSAPVKQEKSFFPAPGDGAPSPGGATPPAQANGSQPTPGAAATPQPGSPAGSPQAPKGELKIVSEGSGEKKLLQYVFEVNRERKFNVDLSMVTKSFTNGQADPVPPPITINLGGTSRTLQAQGNVAQVLKTFSDFGATSKDLPPMVAAGLDQQFAMLKGTQLLATVSNTGEVMGIQHMSQAPMNPAVAGLMQNLQEVLSTTYVPLPAKPVGQGAKWETTITVPAPGMSITRKDVVKLLKLTGEKAEFELEISQTAPKGKMQDPSLPPGVEAELLAFEMKGKRTVEVDLKEMTLSTKAEASTKVESKVSSPQFPEPRTSKSETKTKLHVKYTK